MVFPMIFQYSIDIPETSPGSFTSSRGGFGLGSDLAGLTNGGEGRMGLFWWVESPGSLEISEDTKYVHIINIYYYVIYITLKYL